MVSSQPVAVVPQCEVEGPVTRPVAAKLTLELLSKESSALATQSAALSIQYLFRAKSARSSVLQIQLVAIALDAAHCGKASRTRFLPGVDAL